MSKFGDCIIRLFGGISNEERIHILIEHNDALIKKCDQIKQVSNLAYDIGLKQGRTEANKTEYDRGFKNGVHSMANEAFQDDVGDTDIDRKLSYLEAELKAYEAQEANRATESANDE